METMELKENEMEQAAGGDFLEDMKDCLKILFRNPFAPVNTEEPLNQDTLIGRGKY